ncbi:MAG: hypothetical protein QOH43_995 [Solirubrobacteraceae bacterium]|jgi:hypothetical protein|nr:hypothetical protein [Solirubrobacteraceae bacterium]
MSSDRTPEERAQAAAERARARAGDRTGTRGRAPRRAAAAGAALHRRRRLAAAGTLAGVVGIAAAGFAGLGGGGSKAEPTPAPARARTEAEPRAAQLPGGGRRIFPDRRVVAFYGNPQDPQLGALGIGTPAQAVAKLRRQARGYARGTRPVLPALELVSTVAAASPGAGADYAIRAPAKVVDRYLRAARRAGALLLLDVQPGLNDFPSELRRLRRWLREPDVGLALDPEWRVQPGQVPGKVIGSVGADEVNRTSAQLARIVADGKLPEKLFVIHQFTEDMVRDAQTVVRRPGLATVFNVDGFGDRANKVGKYRALTGTKRGFHHGFKLFYSEDTGLMAPRSVMALQPRPDLIVYE